MALKGLVMWSILSELMHHSCDGVVNLGGDFNDNNFLLVQKNFYL